MIQSNAVVLGYLQADSSSDLRLHARMPSFKHVLIMIGPLDAWVLHHLFIDLGHRADNVLRFI